MRTGSFLVESWNWPTNIGVGIATNSIPLGPLYSYTIITPQNPTLIFQAPILLGSAAETSGCCEINICFSSFRLLGEPLKHRTF